MNTKAAVVRLHFLFLQPQTRLCSSTALLLYCSTALLLYCSTALLLYCSTALLLNCSTALLLYCSTAPILPYCSTALSSTAALLLCCGGTVGEVQGMGKIHFYFVSHLSYLDSGRYFFVIKNYQMKRLKLLIKVTKN